MYQQSYLFSFFFFLRYAGNVGIAGPQQITPAPRQGAADFLRNGIWEQIGEQMRTCLIREK